MVSRIISMSSPMLQNEALTSSHAGGSYGLRLHGEVNWQTFKSIWRRIICLCLHLVGYRLRQLLPNEKWQVGTDFRFPVNFYLCRITTALFKFWLMPLWNYRISNKVSARSTLFINPFNFLYVWLTVSSVHRYNTGPPLPAGVGMVFAALFCLRFEYFIDTCVARIICHCLAVMVEISDNNESPILLRTKQRHVVRTKCSRKAWCVVINRVL